MTASSPVKINRVPFKEWMAAILPVTSTLLQQIHYFKELMATVRVVKEINCPLKNRMRSKGFPK